ncbi:hypothetical protein [Sphingobacterium composti Ten et al. 2007 non Yoo et al. 2007]|uniref:hypothetical protein n=1 Tax=Sphingobacterium composti TaxID=363260 RepID=UPI00135BA728|nr:hypothetical protein [Sphingobacterium composti Ten et al. 2007 non Yoo et al. 2007]
MDTLSTLNKTYHTQFKQALQDPTRLSEEELLELLLKYPYSQPLVFAYERRKNLLNQQSPNKELALLYAHSESWLMNYVNKPVRQDAQPAERYFVEKDSPNIQHGEAHSFENNIPQEEITEEKAQPIVQERTLTSEIVNLDCPIESSDESSNNTYVDEDFENYQELIEKDSHLVEEETRTEEETSTPDLEEDSKENEDLELDRLVHEGSVMGNYFVFDSFENKDIQEIVDAKEESPAITALEEKDDVSLYNDDLMPYSFRWWLHKTRLEYADTYQPYAVSNLGIVTAKPTIDVTKIEDSILDQQIKENIIHFQDPEEKLSEEVKKKPIVPVPPKKGSDIIEKFIQKDPIIQPPSPENINNENMARQSAEDNYLLVTETLANIYIDQGLNQKAIEVFRKLILKYPEKKSYFATRIEELEKNI